MLSETFTKARRHLPETLAIYQGKKKAVRLAVQTAYQVAFSVRREKINNFVDANVIIIYKSAKLSDSFFIKNHQNFC